MLPIHTVEKLLEQAPDELRDIVLEVRSLVAETAPQATEIPNRKGLTYYFRERGGPVSAGICESVIEKDHVRLVFIHGAFLPDPHRLLEGERKAMRWVRIWHYAEAPWEHLRELIALHARFDPRTLSLRPE